MVELKIVASGGSGNSSPPNYVTIDDLASFEANPGEYLRSDNYVGAQKAWQGLNNFESGDGSFGAGHEILARLKPAERIALYIGIAQVKIDERMAKTSHSSRYQTMLEIPNSGFGHLISGLISIGYNYNAIRVMSHKEKSVPSIAERIDSVSDTAKDGFVDALRISWRNPSPVTEFHPYKYPFEDLGIERERTTPENLRWYLKRIVAFMDQVYAANTGSVINERMGT